MGNCRKEGHDSYKKMTVGCAIAQSISFRLSNLAAWVRSLVRFCLWRIKLHWGGFLRVLRFPLPVLSSTNVPDPSIFRRWYSRPTCNQRSKWTQSHTTPRIKKNIRRLYSQGISKTVASPSKHNIALDHWNTEITVRIPHGSLVILICVDRCR
jgi:hypothetical protein